MDAVLGLEPLLPREGDAAPPAGAGSAFLAASMAGEDGSIAVLDAGAMLDALRGVMSGAGVNH